MATASKPKPLDRYEQHGKDMSDARESISNIVDRWSAALGLKWWRKIDITYQCELNEEVPTRVARVDWCKWKYLEASIIFYLPNLIGKSKDETEYIVIHEFMHLMVNEMRDDDETSCDHEERVATSLAMAFAWVRDAGRENRL